MIEFEDLFDDLEKRYSIMVVLPKADNFVVEDFYGDIYDYYDRIEKHQKLGYKIIRQNDDETLLRNDTDEVLIQLIDEDIFN